MSCIHFLRSFLSFSLVDTLWFNDNSFANSVKDSEDSRLLNNGTRILKKFIERIELCKYLITVQFLSNVMDNSIPISLQKKDNLML